MISLNLVNLLVHSRISETQSMELGIGTVAKPQPIAIEGDLHIGDIKVINESSSPAHVQNSELLDGFKPIEWLKLIHAAVDQMELTVADVEEIRVNMADVERMIGVDPTDTTGDLTAISTFKGTNELLTDVKTLLTTATSGQELQVDIVAELPTGTNEIGKLAANSGVDIGDVDVTSLPSAQIGETNQANSMSVTLATDDELLKTVDQSNNLVKVSSPTANNFNVTEANSTSIKTAVEKLDDTVNSNDQLDVNIADGGFDGVVTNTVLTSLDDAINNSKVDVNISTGGFDGTLTGLGEKAQTDSLSVTLATDDDLLNCVDKSNNELNVSIENGGFDGVVTTAANTQLAVTTVQSTFDTGQNSQVGSTARVQVKSASQALQSGITVVASSANTASVFLGDSQVTNSGGTIGFELAAGAGFTFSLSNANLLYAISASGTQTINFVAM